MSVERLVEETIEVREGVEGLVEEVGERHCSRRVESLGARGEREGECECMLGIAGLVRSRIYTLARRMFATQKILLASLNTEETNATELSRAERTATT